MNPVPIMGLVELVRGMQTSDQVKALQEAGGWDCGELG